MSTRYLIGIGAGLVSGVLFASVASGSALAVTLIFFAPLPLYIAGLGWGPLTALLGSASGLAVIVPMLGLKSAIGFLSTLALPAILLCYLASLRQDVAVPAANRTQGGGATTFTNWYPLGRIIAWAALIAGCMSTMSILLLGSDLESYRTSIDAILNRTILQDFSTGTPKPFSKTIFEKYRETFIWMLPAASAIVWLLGAMANLYLSGRIVHTSGRLIRPWPVVADVNYPRNFVFVFAAAVLASFLPGFYGLIATGFVAAFFIAYVLLGLAIIHVITRKLPMRPLLLFTLYFGLLAFGWISLLIAIVGLGDPMFKLRERMSNRGTSPPPPPPPGG